MKGTLYGLIPPRQPLIIHQRKPDCLVQQCQQDCVLHRACGRDLQTKLFAWPREDLSVRTTARNGSHISRSLPPLSEGLQVLATLLPGLSAKRLRQLPYALVARLTSDLNGVCLRLVQLKILFPTADVAKLVARRPTLLLEEEFATVSAAKAGLQRIFPETNLDAMVEELPLLLIEDIDEAMDELQRLIPGSDPQQVLKYQSHMLLSVLKTRNLSIW